MDDKKKFGVKLLFYFGGLIIMTLGVVISVKSDLGVTPISSIPYTVTVVSGMDLGIATMLFSVFMVLLQILILRKRFKPINLLQLPIGILQSLLCVNHQNRDVRSIQLLLCFPNAQFAERAFIVKSRCINNQNRADWEQLHCLSDRIGRGASCFGNDRKLLAGNRVDKTGLSGVSSAEKADMHPLAGRGIV